MTPMVGLSCGGGAGRHVARNGQAGMVVSLFIQKTRAAANGRVEFVQWLARVWPASGLRREAGLVPSVDSERMQDATSSAVRA